MKKAFTIGLLSAFMMSMSSTHVVAQSESAPETFETFAEWCLNQANLSQEATRTVEILLETAGTQNCEQADATLIALTELDLTLGAISDVAPLASLTNLTELNLPTNQREKTPGL